MTTDVTPGAYWRETLAANDREAHAAEADRALLLEIEGLRARCADLTAALTQARAAIEVRHGLLKAQAAAIDERDRQLAEARAAAQAATEAAAQALADLPLRGVARVRRAVAARLPEPVARPVRAVLARLRGHA
jgi:hypothetical protein